MTRAASPSPGCSGGVMAQTTTHTVCDGFWSRLGRKLGTVENGRGPEVAPRQITLPAPRGQTQGVAGVDALLSIDATPHLMSVTHAGPAPAFTAVPAGVKAPVVASTVKAVTLSEPRFATYASRPEASRVSATGLLPAAAVAAGSRAPVVASIAKTETLSAVEFVTYAKWPCESTVREVGPSEVPIRVASGVKAPVAVSMEKIVMSFDPAFVT